MVTYVTRLYSLLKFRNIYKPHFLVKVMSSKKGVEKRVILGILLIGIVIISISFVSASWWNNLFGGSDNEDLEGELAESAVARVKVEDVNPPIVVWVSNVNPTNIVTPNIRTVSGGNTPVIFSFLAQQGGGVGNLNPTSGSINSKATFARTGSTTRLNSSCVTLGQVACGTLCVGNAVNYSCTITMRYYDDPATNWNISATVKDIFNRVGKNSTKQFTVASVSAASSAVNYLNWTNPPLSTSDINRYNDPSTNYMVSNDGNAPIPTTSVNATNLTGITNPAFSILANKFTANPNNPGTCGGTTLGQNTNPPIAGFNVLKAVNDAGNQVQLYFCLMDVAGLSSQEYTGGRAWIITFA